MKDGITRVYLDFEVYANLVLSEAGLDINDEDMKITIGAPTLENSELVIEVAYSNTDVPPEDWGGTMGILARKIESSWGNKTNE